MAQALYYAKLVYNANGGTGAPSAQTAYSDEPSSSVYVVLSAGATRQYYRFNGWAPSSTAGSGRTPGGKYYMTTSDTMYAANARVYTLYATWVHETATLSYNANGGSGAPNSQTVNKNEWFNLRTGVPTRSGYEFVGWNTSSTATAATYQPGDQARIVSNMTLYAIWKVSNSTISSVTSSVEMNGSSTGTISISSINSSYTHVVTISLGSQSQTVNFSAGQTSKTFTIPASWISEVTTSTAGIATVSLKTYNGSTQVGGADIKTFSAVVPSSVVPTLSAAKTNVNSNAVVDGWDILLQTFSQIKLTATASGAYGSTITNYTFSGDGLSQTGASNEATSAVLTTSGERSWTVVVTDSRGRTATATVTAIVYEYFSPSIASLIAFRSDSAGNRDDAAGTYMKAIGVFSYASADGNNTLSVDKIEYQAEDSATWTVGVNNVVSGSPYVFGAGGIVETKLFHVRLSLTDALGNSAQYVVDVAPIVGYGFGLKNDRVHFGGPCKEPGFVCDFDSKFLGTVDVVQRRAYATLSSAGWYRVAEFEPTSAYASYDVQGSIGALIRFFITRRYHWTGNETHEVTLSLAYTSIKWMDESSNSVVQGIDKIRYTTNSNTNKGFIDIHYTLSQANQTAVDFDVACPLDSNGANYQEQIKSMDLVSVADAPVGETILTTYTFSENTDGVGTITAGSIGSIHADSWLVKRNNVVQGYCQTLVNGTLSSGWNIIGILPSGFRPNAQYDYCGVENSADVFMHIRLYPNGNIGVYNTISSAHVSYIKVYFSFVL